MNAAGACASGELPAVSASLFDLHCHLDFDPEPAAAARDAAACGLGLLSATVEPSSYEVVAAALASFDDVRVGLGLHPWWVAGGAAGEGQLAAFERLAPDARFIGEVGLDFGRAHGDTAHEQLAAFERVAAACAQGGRVLTIHAVRSAGEVMDVLERRGAVEGNACVFHWFSGSSEELHRAVKLGFYFSVNPRMLETGRGRAYARAIPAGRLLLETDAPEEGAPYDASARAAQLAGMVDALADLRGASRDDLAEAVAETSRRLLAR